MSDHKALRRYLHVCRFLGFTRKYDGITLYYFGTHSQAGMSGDMDAPIIGG